MLTQGFFGPSETGISAKRKPDIEYMERLKSRKLTTEPPNKLNDHSVYAKLQNDRDEKILDDCPEVDLDIPPFPLLYQGFGYFLDSTRSNYFSDQAFKTEVDMLVKEVCRIEDEKTIQNKAEVHYPQSSFQNPIHGSHILSVTHPTEPLTDIS